MDWENIDFVFRELLEIYDQAWARKTNGILPAKRKQWAEALAGKSREELQQALHQARTTLDTPPTIAQFIKLCPENRMPGSQFGCDHAAKLADSKIKRRSWAPNYDNILLTRDIFKCLMGKIYDTQNEHCDFAVCAAEGCQHFEIFERAYLGAWLCVKHDAGRGIADYGH